jgi:hypothetical protein
MSVDDEYFRNVLVLQQGAIENCEAARIVNANSVERMFRKRPGTAKKAMRNLRDDWVRGPSGLFVRRTVFDVDTQRIERVLFKIMKGIFYIARKVPMPQEFVSTVCDTEFVNGRPYAQICNSMVDWQSFGSNAFMCRYVVFENPPVFFACLIKIYQNRLFYGEAVVPELLKQKSK